VLGGSSVTVAGTGSLITATSGSLRERRSPGFRRRDGSAAVFDAQQRRPSHAAQSSTGALYTTLAGMAGATPAGPELGGVTLTPGVYAFSSTANYRRQPDPDAHAAALYIFKVGSASPPTSVSNVCCRTAPTPCNIYWQVTSAATLNGITLRRHRGRARPV
jgi:type VI secretion system secreted protein VgrG